MTIVFPDLARTSPDALSTSASASRSVSTRSACASRASMSACLLSLVTSPRSSSSDSAVALDLALCSISCFTARPSEVARAANGVLSGILSVRESTSCMVSTASTRASSSLSSSTCSMLFVSRFWRRHWLTGSCSCRMASTRGSYHWNMSRCAGFCPVVRPIRRISAACSSYSITARTRDTRSACTWRSRIDCDDSQSIRSSGSYVYVSLNTGCGSGAEVGLAPRVRRRGPSSAAAAAACATHPGAGDVAADASHRRVASAAARRGAKTRPSICAVCCV